MGTARNEKQWTPQTRVQKRWPLRAFMRGGEVRKEMTVRLASTRKGEGERLLSRRTDQKGGAAVPTRDRLRVVEGLAGLDN